MTKKQVIKLLRKGEWDSQSFWDAVYEAICLLEEKNAR